MPKLKSVGEVIKSFTEQYNLWASKIQKEQKNTQGVWLNTDSGSIYIKSMAHGIVIGDLVVCIASVDINNEYQNKGILSAFIKYIQKNPYIFTEIEVQNIQTEELLDSFLNKGFKSKTDVKDIELMPLTVYINIKVKNKKQ